MKKIIKYFKDIYVIKLNFDYLLQNVYLYHGLN